MEHKNTWLVVECFKHDGTLHRIWDRGCVIENNDDFIVIATKRAKVIEGNGRIWYPKEPAVTIFSKKEWWNSICMLKNEGVTYYANIASPSIVENGKIKYIDYDLDAKLYPDGDVFILDEKEYLKHKEFYKYSNDLDFVLRFETSNIVKKMKNHEFPFNDEIIHSYYEKYLEINKKK